MVASADTDQQSFRRDPVLSCFGSTNSIRSSSLNTEDSCQATFRVKLEPPGSGAGIPRNMPAEDVQLLGASMHLESSNSMNKYTQDGLVYVVEPHKRLCQ